MPRSSLPLDYPNFKSFVEEQDDGRLLATAEEKRRAKLTTVFTHSNNNNNCNKTSMTSMIPPVSPTAISVAFSPRPLESTDLLDDLRCLVRSVETLEYENKRLRNRCSYLSTVNDLLSKSTSSSQLNKTTVASPPSPPPPPPLPLPLSTAVIHHQPQKSPDTIRRLNVVEMFSLPTTEIVPPRSPPTLIRGGQSITTQSQQQPHDKNDAPSSRFTSFGAKMTRAATKFLTKPRKIGGSIRGQHSSSSSSNNNNNSSSLRVSSSKEGAMMMGSSLEPSSSGSSLAEPSNIIVESPPATVKRAAMAKQKSLNEPLSSPVMTLKKGGKTSVDDAELLTVAAAASEPATEMRARANTQEFTVTKSDDEGGSPEPPFSPSSNNNKQGTPMMTTSMVTSTDSLGATSFSSDIIQRKESGSTKHHQRPGFTQKQQSIGEDSYYSSGGGRVTNNSQTSRGRAWTWDNGVKTAASKPWNRLKQMLRRASAPHDASGGTIGMLNDTVVIASRPTSSSHYSRQSVPVPIVHLASKMSSASVMVAQHHHHQTVTPTTSLPSEIQLPKKSCLRMPIVPQDATVNELAKTLHLLALTGCGEVVEKDENQRKQIAKALANIKAEEDGDAKLAELDVPGVVAKHLDPPVAGFIAGVWNDLRNVSADYRTVKRAYLSDRLKLLEWANAHCTRLLNAEQQQLQSGGSTPTTGIKKRFSHRGLQMSQSNKQQQDGGGESGGGGKKRYNESTGLCYGSATQQGQQHQGPATFKAQRISRRWFTIGAADRLSTTQRDVSCRLAASLCALFSSLEPLVDVPPPPPPPSLSTGGEATTCTNRSENLCCLFKEAYNAMLTTKQQQQDVMEVSKASSATIVPNATSLVAVPSGMSVSCVSAVSTESSTATMTPTTVRTPRSLRAMQSRSLSKEDNELVPKLTLEPVNSQPVVSQEEADAIANLFSPTGMANRKHSTSGCMLMSADELMRSVARSRSASIASTNRTTSVITFDTTSSGFPNAGSSNSLLDKRRSIADMPTSTGRNPSLAAIAVAMDFVAVTRQRASSTGSQTGRVRIRTVREPELPVVNMSPPVMSPAANEQRASSTTTTTTITNDNNTAKVTPKTPPKNTEPITVSNSSIDSITTASPTPPLVSVSPNSPLSIRTLDSTGAVIPMTNPTVIQTQQPRLPAVQRIAPIITVSPDRFSSSSQSQVGGRGRIKSLIELSSSSPIGKIFASKNTAKCFGGYNQQSSSHVSGSDDDEDNGSSASGGMLGTTTTSSTMASLSAPSVSNSGSGSSKTTVVSHLCPPPILTGEPASSSSNTSASSSPEPTIMPDIVVSDPGMVKTTTGSSKKDTHSGHFSWFTKLLPSKLQPSPLKRFSSCAIEPSLGENITLDNKTTSLISKTPRSPPHSVGSQSPVIKPASGMARFLRRGSKQKLSQSSDPLKTMTAGRHSPNSPEPNLLM